MADQSAKSFNPKQSVPVSTRYGSEDSDHRNSSGTIPLLGLSCPQSFKSQNQETVQLKMNSFPNAAVTNLELSLATPRPLEQINHPQISPFLSAYSVCEFMDKLRK